MPDLHCGTWGFSSCGKRGLLSSCGVWSSRCDGFSCGRAQLSCGMWNLPRPGIKPASPALAGGFFTTGPPGKSDWGMFGLLPYFGYCEYCLWTEISQVSALTLLGICSRSRIAGSDSDSIFNFLSRSNFYLSPFWPSSTPQAGGQARQPMRVWESSLGLLQRRGLCTEPSRWPLRASSQDFKSMFLRISKTLTLESALGSWQGTHSHIK